MYARGRDVARHGLGRGGAIPSKQKYSPPNKMEPISPFGLWLMFLQDLCETFNIPLEIAWLKHQPK